MDLTQENERLRVDKRQLSDKYRQACDEKESLLMKLDTYKQNLKGKDMRLKECYGELDDKLKTIGGLEEQTEKLVKALQKQRGQEEKMLNDHFSHLQIQIA